MNTDKLIELLEDKGFQDPRTGNLFFGAYIYLYPPQEEYSMQKNIENLTQRLKRPNNFLDCLTIDLFDFFIQYLKENSFSGITYFDDAIQIEKEDTQKAFEYLMTEVEHENFFRAFEEKVIAHFRENKNKRVYLLIHGVGQIYPYLRISSFLKRTEALIKDFKIIVFYPGKYIGNEYSLFNELQSDNIYRVTLLNSLIS